MTAARFLEPMDVLLLRGNRLFGEAGSFGEALLPPWPSVAAGAIRSRLLVDSGFDPDAFARGEAPHPELGTPGDPGPFRLTAFTLARRTKDGIEALYLLPADLVVTETDADALQIRRLRTAAPVAGLDGSCPLDQWPVLAADRQAKPVRGLWLTQAGWRRYLAGEMPGKNDLVPDEKLWALDLRVGVGLDRDKRRAADGKLFTVQAIALHEGVGFLVTVEGVDPPRDGLLRLGGDGRGAVVLPVDAHQPPQADLDAIAISRRARIVLTSPGIFPAGWRLPGMDDGGNFELLGVRGRVVAAAVGRAGVVSGWDLAANKGRGQPKAAQRAAPTGSVYWIEGLQATPEALGKLASHGLWPEEGYDARRRAEGFNRFDWGMWNA